jgi:hypothetical protein
LWNIEKKQEETMQLPPRKTEQKPVGDILNKGKAVDVIGGSGVAPTYGIAPYFHPSVFEANNPRRSLQQLIGQQHSRNRHQLLNLQRRRNLHQLHQPHKLIRSLRNLYRLLWSRNHHVFRISHVRRSGRYRMGILGCPNKESQNRAIRLNHCISVSR